MRKIISCLLLVVGINSAIFGDDRFVRFDKDDAVLDTKTGLMWQDNEEARTLNMTLEDAKNYCANLKLGGYNDWQLPSVDMLRSLEVKSRHYPCISDVFVEKDTYSYWSGSVDLQYGDPYQVNFSYSATNDKTDGSQYELHVRCVRKI